MSKKKAAPESPASPAAMRIFQSFERVIASRSSLNFHPTNPRQIDPHAFKKLKENLKRAGLVTSLIVNKRTAENGFPPSQEGKLVIVGGHQRCKAMDSIADYDVKTHENDYQIPIDMVCISPAKELELLVSLNNQSLMGNYDLDLLTEVLTYPGVDALATGFDKLDLRGMLDSGICDQILGEETPQGIAEAPVLAAIAEISADSKQYTKDREAAAGPAPSAPGPAPGPVQPGAVATPPADVNSVESIKARRHQFQDHVADAGVEAHFTLVANSSDDVEHLLRSLDLPTDQAFVDLALFIDRISGIAGVDLGEILLLADVEEETDLQESAQPE